MTVKMAAVIKILTFARAMVRNIAWVVRPRLPWPLAHRLLARRVRTALASPYRQSVAREQMTDLLADVASAEEIEAAAQRYIEFSMLEEELRWHPRRSTDRRVEGGEHLVAALAEGRGAVLHFAHHGYYSGMFAAVRRATGVRIGVLVRPGALGWNVGPSIRQHMLVARRGGALIHAGSGTGGAITDRLARGEVVAMASDAPGSSVVRFAGHDVTCSSGAVWSAREANTPILVVDTYRDERGPVIRIGAPILPADHEDPKALLQLLVSRHEEAILAWPEATFAPTLAWPRVEPRSTVLDVSAVEHKPFAKALVHNIKWLVHPRLPWPIAHRALTKRIDQALEAGTYDALATEQMTHLLDKVATPEEIQAASDRYTEFMLREAELRWHPRRATDQRVEGLENLRAAQALGRGVVVSFVHHGYYAGMFGAIKRAGIAHTLIVRAGALGWNAGPGQRQDIRVMKRGARLVDVRVGTAGIVERLARGEVVMMALDVPGSSVVTFAGRQVRCTSGTVHAARPGNSPVVLATWSHEEDGAVVRLSPPLLPADFDDPKEMLQHLIGRHEDAVLRWPEAVLMPTYNWVNA
jgi:lauroyl/myristoyl acyltransferase